MLAVLGFPAFLSAQDCPDMRMLAVSRGEKPASASQPFLHADGQGGYWMIFTLRGYEDTQNRLLVQRVDALGKTLFREPGLEVSSLEGDQSEPTAQVFKGSLYLTWRQIAEAGSEGDIYLQQFEANGNIPLSSAGLLICTAPGNQHHPVIQVLATGEVVDVYVAWGDERKGELLPDVRIQKVSGGTLQWNPEGLSVARSDKPRKSPVLCEDTRGGVYLIWEDYRSGTGWQLWYQSYSPQGHPRYGSEGNLLMRPDASSQTALMAVPDGFGGFFFTCEKMDIVNFETDIYFGRIQHNGQLVYQYAACSAFGEQKNPRLSQRISEVILTWEDKRSGNWDVWGQYITIRDGRPQWEHNGIPLADGSEDQTNAGMFSTVEYNDILMVWSESATIRAQKLNVFGERLWNPSGVVVGNHPGRQENPALCRNGEGGCWIAWTDYREGVKVYFQHLSISGTALQRAEGVTFIRDPEQHSGTGIENLSLLQASGDSLWVVWEDYRKGPNDPDIYLAKTGPDGIGLFVDNGLPVCTEVGEQTRPQMISDGAGGIWVVWVDRRNNRDEDVYYQHIMPGGYPYFPVTGRVLVSAPRSQAQVQIKPDGRGGFWAVWTDAREYKNQGFEVYLQRVNARGEIEEEPGGLRLSQGNHDSHTPVLASGPDGSVGLLWMDNANGYFNIRMQVFFSDGQRLFEESGKTVSPALAHQRQPALTFHQDHWLLAWSEERYGQGRDRIFLLPIHVSGQLAGPGDGFRMSTGSGRQLRPGFTLGNDTSVLLTWQEQSERPDEGVMIRCRRLIAEKWEHQSDAGRLVARLTDEKEGVLAVWHSGLSRYLISWTEQKTKKTAVWTQEPYPTGAIPDRYEIICPSRFPQRGPKGIPLGQNSIYWVWAESRDTHDFIYRRMMEISR